MAWIIPHNLPALSPTSLSAPDTKVSDLDLDSFSQRCAKSLMWSGTHTPPLTWLRRLKRVNWLQHLCIRMCRSSHSQTFTALWTSSVRDSLASRFPFQANFNPLKTRATYSLTSSEASENAGQQLSFWKTWKESFPLSPPKENPFSSMSSTAWNEWATAQRLEFSVRTKWERPTKDAGYLSWPTQNVPTNCLLGREVHKAGPADSMNRNVSGSDRGRLNPDWVEQLQGLPRVGWSALGCWGTESLRTPPPKRSSLLPQD
jgi:hypothetical protein